MPYKKYINKNGKVYGPYIYRSRREDGKVITEYIGKPKEKKKKSWPFLLIIFLILSFTLLFFLSQTPRPTGKIILEPSPVFKFNETITGEMKIKIRQGELIPKDTKLHFKLNKQETNITLSDLVKNNLTEGNFYAENTNLEGYGEGFGLIGEKKIYPTVYFKILVYSVRAGGSGGEGEEEIEESEKEKFNESVENATEIKENFTEIAKENETGEILGEASEGGNVTTEKIEGEGSEEEIESTTEGQEQINEENLGAEQNEESNNVESETSENLDGGVSDSSSESVESGGEDKGESAESNSEGGEEVKESEEIEEGGESSEASGVEASSGITGSIIQDSQIVEGSVKYGEKFEIEVGEGKAASVVQGSVYTESKNLSSDVLDVSVKNGVLEVETNYYETEKGYGKDYLGNETGTLIFNLENINFKAEKGKLYVVMDYDGTALASIEKTIRVSEKGFEIENVTINITTTKNASLIKQIREIEDLTIKKEAKYSLNLSDYFKSKYKISYSAVIPENVSMEIEGDNLTIYSEGFEGTRACKIIATVKNVSIESNLFNIIISKSNITMEVLKYGRLGRPIKWVKRVKLEKPGNLTLNLPKNSKNITVKKISEEKTEKAKSRINGSLMTGQVTLELELRREPEFLKFLKKLWNSIFGGITGKVIEEVTDKVVIHEDVGEDVVGVAIEDNATEYIIEYETPAPEAKEIRLDKGKKKIKIESEIPYTDILAYTFIEESKPEEIKVKGAENYELIDNNKDGLIDEIDWIADTGDEIQIEIHKKDKAVERDAFSTTYNLGRGKRKKIYNLIQKNILKNGNYVSATNVIDVYSDYKNKLYVNFNNLSLELKPYYYKQGEKIYLENLTDYDVLSHTHIYDNGDFYKYAFGIFNFSKLRAEKIGFDVFSNNEVRVEGNALISQNIKVDFSDIAENYSLTLNQDYVEISGNFSSDLWLDPQVTYKPNMTGGQAWKDDVVSYITGLDEITTAYTQTQLNEISEEDGGYVSQDYVDGPDCFALTPVADCGSLGQTDCNSGNYYQTSDNYFCIWTGSFCIGGPPCGTLPYHQIKFKISEDPNNINNVSVRVAAKHSGSAINLLAWNFTSGKFVKLWSGSGAPETPVNATGTIYDADNFINSSGDFYIAFNTTYGIAYIDYAEVGVDYTSGGGGDTTPPTVNLISPANDTTISTSTIYFAANFTDNANLENATLYVWNSSLSLINITTETKTGTSNLSNISVTLPYDDTFYWNYYVCDNSTNCAWNNTNYTLTVDSTLPNINFTSPTPGNATSTSNTSIEINISINESSLGNVKYNWNGTNFTFYDDSLILMYNFNSYTLLNDTSKYSHEISSSTATWTSSGKYGGAYVFDGSNDYIELNDSSYINLMTVTNRTFEMWFKAGVTNGKHVIYKEGGQSHGFNIYIEANHLFAGFWSTTDITPTWLNTSFTDTSKWHHVVFSFDSTAGVQKLYLDGVEKASASETGDVPSHSGDICIGYSDANLDYHNVSDQSGNFYFDGTIDELRIWNRSLTASEINQLYMSNLYKYDANKWALYINQTKNSTAGLEPGTYTYYGCASDTNSNENCTETRQVTITGAPTPKINLDLITPAPGTTQVNVTQNQFFNVTVNVTCLQADCGEVNVSLDPNSQKTYKPNMTGGNAYKDSLVYYATHPDNITTAYTQTQLNEISEEDGGYVNQPGAGGEDCSNLQYTSDCSGLGQEDCNNYYDGSYTCFWVDGPNVCVENAPCQTNPYHKIKFNINEDSSNINNISVRLVSQHQGPVFSLLAWNFTSNSFVQLWSGSYIPGTVFNATGVIYDAQNFINSGNLYLVWNMTGNDMDLPLDYAEVIVDYTTGGGGVKGLISTTTGATPFYTNESNPRNISLNKDESQLVTFWVNATGSIGSNYTFFVYANKTSDMSISNITNSWNVTVISGADTTPPIFTYIDNVTIYNNESVGIDFNATDETAFDCFSVNDTTHFSINCSGWLENITALMEMKILQ